MIWPLHSLMLSVLSGMRDAIHGLQWTMSSVVTVTSCVNATYGVLTASVYPGCGADNPCYIGLYQDWFTPMIICLTNRTFKGQAHYPNLYK